MAAAQRAPTREDWRTLGILGVPTFAFALAITVVSTYLPVLAESFGASAIIVGLLIGGEGLFALWLPLVVGTWSDHLHTPLGRRLPFILGATPPLVVATALLGFADSVAAAAVIGAVFFAAYFVAYEPYRALYPDLVDDAIAGRAQGSQAIFRGLGTFLALVGGGLLISMADWLPFVAGAAIVLACLGAFGLIGVRRVRARRAAGPPPRADDLGDAAGRLFDLVRGRPRLQAFLVANALWELALAALKTFVVLYVTRSVGLSLASSSLAIGTVALFVLAGALISGELGDRVGRVRVMRASLVVYAVGLLVPFASTTGWIVALAAPLVAFGGGVTMSLPYALLMPMMPAGAHGALTGFYSLSRGLGVALGPLLGGVAIQAWGGDYRAMWLVCAAAIALSVPLLHSFGDGRFRVPASSRPR